MRGQAKDLRKRFNVAVDQDTIPFNKLIIVSVKGRIVGLKVDKVLGELRVDADEVRPAPSMLSAAISEDGVDFFSGVCKVEGDVVFVVNLEGLIVTTEDGYCFETTVELEPAPA